MVRISKGNRKQINYLIEKEYRRLLPHTKPKDRRRLRKAIKKSIINQLRR